MKKNNISQDSMKKVEFILNQKRDEQTDIDLIIKFQLKIFFVKKMIYMSLFTMTKVMYLK